MERRNQLQGASRPAKTDADRNIGQCSLQLDSAETDRKELAMKYYQDTLSEEKEQLQGVKI